MYYILIYFIFVTKRIFDSEEQFFEVVDVVRSERKRGGKVGIFGSRSRGNHVIGVSDVDIIVEKEGVNPLGEYDFGNVQRVNVVRVSPDVDGDDKNSQVLLNIKRSARWFR